ncbi:uncharacterized protein LOC142765866 [Rhipicephalus microplus]|uniref:uncharacterized protein LOC142765866 n=1 Tax=Rhipicephalus microplus TaxID=6941 RepID=UPI003F6C0FC2
MAMLLLLDVESAFDGLPQVAVEAALDRLGISGSLRGFVTAFLPRRTFCVCVGGATSQPRDITAGVPQGSVLSPFLFNTALAGLPASLPTDTRFPARCSVYADYLALWVRGPRRSIPAIRRSLQPALDAVITYLGGIGLKVSATKTEALLIHPLAAARTHVRRLRLGNRSLPWRLVVKYLGLTIDHRLTWIPAAKAAATKVRRVQGPISRLQLRGHGCSTKWALRLNQAAASSYGPRSASPGYLSNASPPATRGPPLLGRGNQATDACDRTATGGLLQAPGTTGGTAAGVHGRICDAGRDRSGRMRNRAQSQQQAVQATLPGELHGCGTGWTPSPGRPVGRGHPLEPAAVLCDSKAALQTLANSRRAGLAACLLTAKVRAFTDAGVSVSFHWLPSHVGIAGNEKADTLAKAAHQPGTPYSCAVAARDYSQARLERLLVTLHLDSRVASERGLKPLPETGLTRRERASLLRLRTGCVWTAAPRHAKGLCPSPACSRCGDPETLEHLLCACPGLAQERLRAYTAYRRQGLPVSTLEHLLFPSPPHPATLRSLAEFVEESGIAAYR